MAQPEVVGQNQAAGAVSVGSKRAKADGPAGSLGVEKGASLRKALQKFQKEHDLPATGMLDQRTTEALGLDPDDLFERASGS